jgi:hypothetical protein
MGSGIGIGTIVIVVIALVGGFYLYKKMKSKQQVQSLNDFASPETAGHQILSPITTKSILG